MISSPESRSSSRVGLVAILIIFALISGTAASVTAFGQEMAVTKVKVIVIPSQSKEIIPLRFFPTENDEDYSLGSFRRSAIFVCSSRYSCVLSRPVNL